MIKKATVACKMAFIFPLTRAAKATPLKAHKVLKVLTKKSR
jgi:hypothetical protein